MTIRKPQIGVKKTLTTKAEKGSCPCFFAADATELQPIRYATNTIQPTDQNNIEEAESITNF